MQHPNANPAQHWALQPPVPIRPACACGKPADVVEGSRFRCAPCALTEA